MQLYTILYIDTHPLSHLLLTCLSVSSLRKTIKVILRVMKPVGPYRNIKYDSLHSYELVIAIFPKNYLPFRPISGLFSMPSLFTYFIKICVDGHGWQSKSPKSKKFYPQASTKSFPVVWVTLTNLLYRFEVIANKTKRYSAVGELVILEDKFMQFT